jgi:hypothetical protein
MGIPGGSAQRSHAELRSSHAASFVCRIEDKALQLSRFRPQLQGVPRKVFEIIAHTIGVLAGR